MAFSQELSEERERLLRQNPEKWAKHYFQLNRKFEKEKNLEKRRVFRREINFRVYRPAMVEE